MKHLVVVVDWKDEFPIDTAVECRSKWGALYAVEADSQSDAVVWLFSNKLVTEVDATEIYEKERLRAGA